MTSSEKLSHSNFPVCPGPVIVWEASVLVATSQGATSICHGFSNTCCLPRSFPTSHSLACLLPSLFRSDTRHARVLRDTRVHRRCFRWPPKRESPGTREASGEG